MEAGELAKNKNWKEEAMNRMQLLAELRRGQATSEERLHQMEDKNSSRRGTFFQMYLRLRDVGISVSRAMV